MHSQEPSKSKAIQGEFFEKNIESLFVSVPNSFLAILQAIWLFVCLFHL